jgi:hypothetical protein
LKNQRQTNDEISDGNDFFNDEIHVTRSLCYR